MQPQQAPLPQNQPPQGMPATNGNPASNTAEPETPRNPNSTQNSLLISEIRDGMVIMADGSFRAVIACQSINFDLMSDREREGIEYSYQSFLNSLYFPVQIFIRSQRVDIGPYLDKLSKIRRDQDNMLLGMLMDDYINFIAVLSDQANIMDKSFFVIVPYFPTGDVAAALSNSKNIFSALLKPQKSQKVVIDQTAYSKAQTEIQNRIGVITSGLFQMGVHGVPLKTRELAALYYNTYNPDTAVREPLGDFQSVTGTFVQKGQGQAPQPHLNREVI